MNSSDEFKRWCELYEGLPAAWVHERVEEDRPTAAGVWRVDERGWAAFGRSVREAGERLCGRCLRMAAQKRGVRASEGGWRGGVALAKVREIG
jgi:hypothetical protein